MAIFNTVYRGMSKWKPGSDVYFWLPLKKDVNDHSGNNRNGTLTGSGTYENNGLTLTKGNYITCVQPGNQSKFTMSMYLKVNNAIAGGPYNKYYYTVYGWRYEGNNNNSGSRIGYYFSNNSYSLPLNIVGDAIGGSGILDKSFNSGLNSWYNIIYTWDNGTAKLYINGELVGTRTGCTRGVLTSQSLMVNNFGNGWGNDVSVGDIIFATDTWTQDYVTDYYDQTKSNYGL